MAWLKSLFGRKADEQVSAFHLDFLQLFPHVYWTSPWKEAGGFKRYKVLSARQEPSERIQVVVLEEGKDGARVVHLRFEAPRDDFDSNTDFISDLEKLFEVTFDRVDLSSVRTVDAMIEKCRQIGWEVS
jgi:hypothetical protein